MLFEEMLYDDDAPPQPERHFHHRNSELLSCSGSTEGFLRAFWGQFCDVLYILAPGALKMLPLSLFLGSSAVS